MPIKLSIAIAKRTGTMGQKGGDKLRIVDSVFVVNNTCLLVAVRMFRAVQCKAQTIRHFPPNICV